MESHKNMYGLVNRPTLKIFWRKSVCRTVNLLELPSITALSSQRLQMKNNVSINSCISLQWETWCIYLSVSTRPEITYAVGNLARFSSKPTKSHWTALKRVLRYLKGTVKYGVLYSQKGSYCVGYSDDNLAGDINDWKSISGYMFQISGGAVTWRSCVALSMAEAEYIALSSSA